jgi:hypothetical protein
MGTATRPLKNESAFDARDDQLDTSAWQSAFTSRRIRKLAHSREVQSSIYIGAGRVEVNDYRYIGSAHLLSTEVNIGIAVHSYCMIFVRAFTQGQLLV